MWRRGRGLGFGQRRARRWGKDTHTCGGILACGGGDGPVHALDTGELAQTLPQWAGIDLGWQAGDRDGADGLRVDDASDGRATRERLARLARAGGRVCGARGWAGHAHLWTGPFDAEGASTDDDGTSGGGEDIVGGVGVGSAGEEDVADALGDLGLGVEHDEGRANGGDVGEDGLEVGGGGGVREIGDEKRGSGRR